MSTDSLLPELQELIERLRNYNPPDRTVYEQRQMALDIQDAASALQFLAAAMGAELPKEPMSSQYMRLAVPIEYPAGAELPKHKRYCGRAMTETFSSQTGKPSGEYVASADYDALYASVRAAAWPEVPPDDWLKAGIKMFQHAYSSSDSLSDWRAFYQAMRQCALSKLDE